MTRNTIEGILILSTPMHCAAPIEARVDDGNNVRFGSGAVGKPCTTTMQQPVISPAGRTFVPYFPANDFRGRLRRKGAKRVLANLVNREGPVSLSLYQGLNCGASNGQPESSEITMEEVLRAKSNIYMGLFGGGARLLRSRFAAQDIMPVLRVTVDAKMVPACYGDALGQGGFVASAWQRDSGGEATQRPLEARDILSLYHMYRVDDTFRVLRAEEMNKFIAGGAESVAGYQEDILLGRQKRKESKADDSVATLKKSDLSNMTAIQAIAPGTPMYFRISMEDLTDAQIGLLCHSLRDLLEERALGGLTRNGMGQFEIEECRVRIDEAEGIPLDAACERYEQAMQDELSQLSARVMEAFFASSKDVEGDAPPTASKAKGKTGDKASKK